VCRTGSSSSGARDDPAPNGSTATPQPIGLTSSVSALADRSNPRLPWVVSRSGGTYFRNGCGGAAHIPPAERLYFRTEEEVRRIGFTHATEREDACDAKGLAWHRALVDTARPSQPLEQPQDSSWVGSVADGVYFRRSCSAAQDLAPVNRRYFSSEAAAIAEGYRHSRTPGC
jgi:hypothetical protein